MQSNLSELLGHVGESVGRTESASTEIKVVSTKTISTVQTQQARIEDVAAVERTSKVTSETAALTVQAGKALDEILSGTTQASKLSAEIRVATDQQAKASDEVAGALTGISRMVQESASAFQQLNAEAGKLSDLGAELVHRMKQFKL
ncbi:MAG: hypothetical protein HYT87_19175 [Nitrospirae bacterium]|nr:hypothetical protein [Nitrospirota bacterium]